MYTFGYTEARILFLQGEVVQNNIVGIYDESSKDLDQFNSLSHLKFNTPVVKHCSKYTKKKKDHKKLRKLEKMNKKLGRKRK